MEGGFGHGAVAQCAGIDARPARATGWDRCSCLALLSRIAMKPLIREAVETVLPEHDMVEALDPEQLPGLTHALGQLAIRRAAGQADHPI